MKPLALTKELSLPEQKVHSYKEIKEKEINKNTKNNFVNKQSINNDEIIHRLTYEYRLKGMSKELCLRVVEEVLSTNSFENFGGYLRSCLENTIYRNQVKHGLIDPMRYLKED
ncbi:hypothetical protein LAV79_22860 [Peribacillus butanolivorans]|uniref:hypothetical protein n=1 Tax=Peribacillus butanolivorans TaxID=421767 RepID=UPI0030C9B61D